MFLSWARSCIEALAVVQYYPVDAFSLIFSEFPRQNWAFLSKLSWRLASPRILVIWYLICMIYLVFVLTPASPFSFVHDIAVLQLRGMVSALVLTVIMPIERETEIRQIKMGVCIFRYVQDRCCPRLWIPTFHFVNRSRVQYGGVGWDDEDVIPASKEISTNFAYWVSATIM